MGATNHGGHPPTEFEEEELASTPPSNAALLQEVDEAVRRDTLESVWKRYGRWIVVAVIAALLAFGGLLFWQNQQRAAAGEDAEKLVEALKKGPSDAAGAAKILTDLEQNGGDAYRAAARLQQANVKLTAGDGKGAAALLAQIVADDGVDQALRDHALIRQTAIEFDTLKPELVVARMQPIIDRKDPVSGWFPSAAELAAAAHYRAGQLKEAGALYGRIARMEDAPPSLVSRAKQMAGMLGVDAVTETPATTIKKTEAKGG
ncbi:MAG: hypothetical protein RLZZ58_830 [Pseudomonadota bacterium]